MRPLSPRRSGSIPRSLFLLWHFASRTDFRRNWHPNFEEQNPALAAIDYVKGYQTRQGHAALGGVIAVAYVQSQTWELSDRAYLALAHSLRQSCIPASQAVSDVQKRRVCAAGRL